jgi:putative sigma-54 modulation protein
MRLELTGRHVRITPGIKRLVDEGLQKLDRLLHERAVSLQVVLEQEKYRHRAEVTLHARGEHFLHGAGTGQSWDLALNQALAKINQQARKLKGKWDEGKRQRVSAAKASPPAALVERGIRRGRPEMRTDAQRPSEGDEGGRTLRVVRVRSRAAKPMTIEDAAAELGGGNDAVIVFRNSSTDAVTVLFRRPDGNLGLIEPEP